jgi:hypothetical protein
MEHPKRKKNNINAFLKSIILSISDTISHLNEYVLVKTKIKIETSFRLKAVF